MRSDLKRLLAGAALLGLLQVGSVEVASAAEVLVTAEFEPSALDPARTTFRNTTAPGFYCGWRPEFCSSDGAYAIDIPLGLKKTYKWSGELRERFYLQLPPPRSVVLTNIENGLKTEVKLSIETISGSITPGGRENPVWTQYVGGGCAYVRTSNLGARVNFGWTVRDPQAPAPCWSRGDAASEGPVDYVVQTLGLGLRISANSPLELTSGLYEGETIYFAGGAGSDLDFGDGAADEPITIRFQFRVTHQFHIEFPSDSPQVSLVPEGGWRQWIEHGKPPARLRNELPFYVTASMELGTRMRCDHELDGRCAIRDSRSGKTVPVDVDITIPGMRNVRDGRPAQNTPLLSDDARAPRFTPDGYLIRRRSTLRFTADREAVTEMLKSPSSHWQGNMTVVFDTNP